MFLLDKRRHEATESSVLPRRAMRNEMARGEISTAPFASLLAHPGKPILAGGRVLTRFAPNRALVACGRSRHAPTAIEHGTEELLQCKRVEFATAACRRVRMKRRPPAALENSLPAQFITYQNRNSVQLNGATSFNPLIRREPTIRAVGLHGECGPRRSGSLL